MKRSIISLTSLAALAVASACIASTSTGAVEFTLSPDRDPAKIHASFHDGTKPEKHDNWSTGFMPSELIGLEVSSFRAAGTRPLHFTLAREAGRLDCSGSGGGESASGDCRFTMDEGFAQLLASRGVGRPTHAQAFALMAVNAHRDLLDALAAAHFQQPSVDDYIAMSALNVSRTYIASLATAGYRPTATHSLIEFKALGITPEFVVGFQQLGYRDLTADRFVEFKAMNITPEFVRSVMSTSKSLPPADDLVNWKIFGRPR